MPVARQLLRQLGYEIAAAELERPHRAGAGGGRSPCRSGRGSMGRSPACCTYSSARLSRSRARRVVQALVVDAKLRGRGIGKALDGRGGSLGQREGSRLGCPVDAARPGLLHAARLRQSCNVGPDAQGIVRAEERPMIVRRDHVAGGMFIVAGALVLAVSGDLPFGTLASPGAGMLPKLVIGLMMAFGADPAPARRREPALRARRLGRPPARPARRRRWPRPPSRSTPARVSADHVAAAVQADLRGRAQADPAAVLFSAGVTGLTYVLFNTLLKSPLPRGPLWF